MAQIFCLVAGSNAGYFAMAAEKKQYEGKLWQQYNTCFNSIPLWQDECFTQ